MSESVKVFSAKLPRYHGRGLGLEVEIAREFREALTVELVPVNMFEELSICGAAGQNREEIARTFAGEPIIGELCDIWARYHLNGMRTGTRRQRETLAAIRARTGAALDTFDAQSAALDAATLTGDYQPERRPAEPSDWAHAEKRADHWESERKRYRLAAGHGPTWQTEDLPLDFADIEHGRKLCPQYYHGTPGKKGAYFERFKVAEELAKWAEEQRDECRAKVAAIKAGGVVYGYGSRWLVEPLPPEVSARVRKLCAMIEAESNAPDPRTVKGEAMPRTVHDLLPGDSDFLGAQDTPPPYKLEGGAAEAGEGGEDSDEGGDDSGEGGELWAIIDGERYEIDETADSYGALYIESGAMRWRIFESREAAGEAARDHWREMAESDPREFAVMVGDDTLTAWALGRSAGPGSAKVRSLAEWLDIAAASPEELFANYDGQACKVLKISEALADELGFESGAPDGDSGDGGPVAYRES